MRDLQEDKEDLFDAADTLRGSLEVMTGVVGRLVRHCIENRKELRRLSTAAASPPAL